MREQGRCLGLVVEQERIESKSQGQDGELGVGAPLAVLRRNRPVSGGGCGYCRRSPRIARYPPLTRSRP